MKFPHLPFHLIPRSRISTSFFPHCWIFECQSEPVRSGHKSIYVNGLKFPPSRIYVSSCFNYLPVVDYNKSINTWVKQNGCMAKCAAAKEPMLGCWMLIQRMTGQDRCWKPILNGDGDRIFGNKFRIWIYRSQNKRGSGGRVKLFQTKQSNAKCNECPFEPK